MQTDDGETDSEMRNWLQIILILALSGCGLAQDSLSAAVSARLPVCAYASSGFTTGEFERDSAGRPRRAAPGTPKLSVGEGRAGSSAEE